MSIRAIRDRIHTLLTTNAGVRRALSNTLRKELVSADTAIATAETLAPSYVLRWAGDTQTNPRDIISADSTIRQSVFSLQLSVFCGTGENSGSDTQEADADLADLWENVVAVLEDPNNFQRASTGWLWSGNFSASAPSRPEGASRVTLNATFAVKYDAAMASL